MKQILFSALLLIFAVQVNGQALNINSVEDIALQANKNKDEIEAKGKFVAISDIEGTPYMDDEFKQGQILIGNKDKSVNTFIRYRVFDDIFEVKESESDAEVMDVERSANLTVKIGNKTFVFVEDLPKEIRGAHSGYAQEMIPETEDQAGLYKRMSQEYKPEQESKSGYDRPKPPKLIDEDHYFIKIDGTFYELEPHKKRIVKNLPEHQKEMKKTVSKNRWKFKKKNRDMEMMSFVNNYNKL